MRAMAGDVLLCCCVAVLLCCCVLLQGEDIYGDLVGPTYRADLWVQTWMNGTLI